MPVLVKEIVGSQGARVSLEDDTVEFLFIAWGSNSEGEVRDAVIAKINELGGLLGGGTIQGGLANLLFQDLQLTHLGAAIWKATASYALKVPRGATTGNGLFDNGVLFRNFEIGTQQQKVNVAKSTVYSNAFFGPEGANPALIPDWHGAIGKNGNKIEGTQVQIPVHNWSRTHYFDPATIDDAYEVALRNLVASPVNDAPFKGHARGECLFQGASGGLRDNANFEVTFRFASQPNLTSITIGGITFVGADEDTIIKEGWDYLDIEFVPWLEPHALGFRPKFIRVQRVYDKSSYDVLGIGS